MLVTTSFNDSQVMYWEPAKYVARLRTVKTDGNPLLLKIKMDPAGHGGASGRYDRLKDQAFEYAWMLTQDGITKRKQREERPCPTHYSLIVSLSPSLARGGGRMRGLVVLVGLFDF